MADVSIHPIAALTVAERQNVFDKNEKLLLQQQVFELTEIRDAQLSRIKELEIQNAALNEQIEATK